MQGRRWATMGTLTFAAAALASCSSTGAPKAVTPTSGAESRPGIGSGTLQGSPVAECTRSDLRASEGIGNGAGGTTFNTILLTNESATSCRLQGYAALSAVAAGKPPVTAQQGSPSFVSPLTTVAPGQTASIVLRTFAECAAWPGGGGQDLYSTVKLELPSGETMTIQLAPPGLDLKCGLVETPFGGPPAG